MKPLVDMNLSPRWIGLLKMRGKRRCIGQRSVEPMQRVPLLDLQMRAIEATEIDRMTRRLAKLEEQLVYCPGNTFT